MRGRQTTPELVATLVSLRKKGLSLNEICQETGLSKSTVFSYVRSIILSSDQKYRIAQKVIDATIKKNQLKKALVMLTP